MSADHLQGSLQVQSSSCYLHLLKQVQTNSFASFEIMNYLIHLSIHQRVI